MAEWKIPTGWVYKVEVSRHRWSGWGPPLTPRPGVYRDAPSESEVQVLGHEGLHDLVEVVDGISVQILFAVIHGVPDIREGKGDEEQNWNTSVKKRNVVILDPPFLALTLEIRSLQGVVLEQT